MSNSKKRFRALTINATKSRTSTSGEGVLLQNPRGFAQWFPAKALEERGPGRWKVAAWCVRMKAGDDMSPVDLAEWDTLEPGEASPSQGRPDPELNPADRPKLTAPAAVLARLDAIETMLAPIAYQVKALSERPDVSIDMPGLAAVISQSLAQRIDSIPALDLESIVDTQYKILERLERLEELMTDTPADLRPLPSDDIPIHVAEPSLLDVALEQLPSDLPETGLGRLKCWAERFQASQVVTPEPEPEPEPEPTIHTVATAAHFKLETPDELAAVRAAVAPLRPVSTRVLPRKDKGKAKPAPEPPAPVARPQAFTHRTEPKSEPAVQVYRNGELIAHS